MGVLKSRLNAQELTVLSDYLIKGKRAMDRHLEKMGQSRLQRRLSKSIRALRELKSRC